MRNVKPLGTLALLVSGALVTAACGSASPGKANTSPVNIGAIFSLTGSAGPAGTARLEGVEIAVQDINAAGGILGRKVNLIPADTASDAVDAVTVARQMLATDNLSMAVGLTALDWPNALPLFCNSPMVMFENVADPSLDTKYYKYCYRAVPSDGLEGTALAMAASQLGYKRVALAFEASADAATIFPSLQRAAAKLGLTIVANPQLPVGVPSYSAEALQIINSHPDAVIMSLLPETVGSFFQSFEQLGGRSIPVVASDTSLITEWINAVGAQVYARQVVGVQASASSQGPGAADFFPVFKSRFGSAPRSNSANGYDATIVGALAMVAAHSTDPTVYQPFISQVTTPGPGVTTVYSYAQGVQLLKEGKKIKYSGIASEMTFNQYHAITGPFEVDRVPVGGQPTPFINLTAAAMAAVIS